MRVRYRVRVAAGVLCLIPPALGLAGVLHWSGSAAAVPYIGAYFGLTTILLALYEHRLDTRK